MKAANFIGNIRWCRQGGENAGGAPGITWLELFFWFKMHASKEAAVKALAKEENLNKKDRQIKTMSQINRRRMHPGGSRVDFCHMLFEGKPSKDGGHIE